MAKTLAVQKEKTLSAIMDINEMAGYLGLSPVTVIKKAEKGEIPAFKIGSLWKFRADTIEKWLNEKEEAAGFDRLSFEKKVDFTGRKIREGFERAGYKQEDIPRLIAGVREKRKV